MVAAPAKCPVMEDLGRRLQQWALTFSLQFRWREEFRWIGTHGKIKRVGTPRKTTKIEWSELQDTTKLNPMIDLDSSELQAMANYQFTNNFEQLAAMLGAQETGQAECPHTD